jgi:hypothetical protein
LILADAIVEFAKKRQAAKMNDGDS